jgi:eukaryotic-like serine/threonine-protein kinase
VTLPRYIGKYEIRRELGRGSMGAVYEAYDPIIERRVAIKTILAQYLADEASDSAAARFKREAQAGGRLQHPGIVALYEYGEDAGMAYIVMEYLEGEDLRRLVRRTGRLPLIDTYGLTRQLLMALAYSHRQQVVHRDIKPANLMVLHGLKLKVMDFGIARIHSSTLTQRGSVFGTPAHMAPEQLRGQVADARADLWAAGVILYELLTGCTPFAADSPAAVVHHVMNAEPVLPSTLDPSIAPAFDAVVARALAKRPEARFQSADEFSLALLAAFRGKPAAEAVAPSSHGADGTLSPAQTARYEHTGTVGAAQQIGPLSSTLPPHTLAEIEASLARSIGPLAKRLVRQSAAQTHSVQAFYAALADNVPQGPEREAFLERIGRLDTGSTGGSLGSGAHRAAAAGSRPPGAMPEPFDPAVLARCELHLAKYIGPLAGLLIKRAANDSGNVSELVRKLAEHIDNEAERHAFLQALR